MKQVAGLHSDNQILREIAANLKNMNHAKIYYARTPDEQQVVDLVVKAAKPIDELKDKLGIK